MLTDFVTVTHIGPMAQIENPRWRGRDLENHKKNRDNSSRTAHFRAKHI